MKEPKKALRVFLVELARACQYLMRFSHKPVSICCTLLLEMSIHFSAVLKYSQVIFDFRAHRETLTVSTCLGLQWLSKPIEMPIHL